MQIGWGWGLGWGLDLGQMGKQMVNREVNLTQNFQINQISMDCLREKGNHVLFPSNTLVSWKILEINTANSEHSTFLMLSEVMQRMTSGVSPCQKMRCIGISGIDTPVTK